MSPNSIPNKIKSFLDLIRFNKPIGVTLLLWPCYFALAILPNDPLNYVKWYIIFLLGSFLMRSAGCIINDLVDIQLDKKVTRTSKRPLVDGRISKFEAISFLFILLVAAFLILMLFNIQAIVIALFSLPLIIIYPYMKRFTYWPQLVLGLVFSWGILITSMQFNGYISSVSAFLYVSCIFWTLGYDTIYAYQDRKSDIKNNIKSTAVLFGNQGKKCVLLFYIIFFCIIGYIGFQTSGSIASICVIILFLIIMMFFLNKWNLESEDSSNKYFKFNDFIGLFCFVYLILF